MIKIEEREEEFYIISSLETIELSKVLHAPRYAEFIELMNTINSYKNKFMSADILN
jgi:hypothetical protein